MEKIFLYLLSFLGGALCWSLRSLLLEKTMKRRASDQYVTLGELDLYRRRERDTDKGFRKLELDHLKELFEKDLSSNTARLSNLEGIIEKQTTILMNLEKKLYDCGR